ncbi:MAG: type II secretion system protein N [Hyphomonadaceae bacterium]
MRIVIFVVLGIIALVGGGIAFFPMSMAADMASKQIPDFKYTDASGSVWDGKLTNVSFGNQHIGDLSVKADLLALFTGRASGALGLVREGFSGQADLAYGIGDGGLDIKDMKIEGATGAVPGMPTSIAHADGKFLLQVKELKFANSACETAAGEVWTDALTKVNVKGWVGPELRGPVSCAGGKLQVQATGKAATGEDVLASLNISSSLDIDMTATVTNVSPAAKEALTQIGFLSEGDALVLRQGLGSR